MSSTNKWVRIFDVPEYKKHKKGFTIYKVISMLYPESCPDAITKITVWKRFNDFKKLYRDMKVLQKTLKIKEKMPQLPSSPFYKRFDEEVIRNRQQSIYIFLEYIASHHNLFTSNDVVKFFQSSHTPSEMLTSSINSIRAELSLPTEPEFCSLNSPSSDEEHSTSDTESISTLSSFSVPSISADILMDPLYKSTSTLSRLSKRSNSECSFASSQLSKTISSDTISVTTVMSSESLASTNKNLFPTPPTTPNTLESDSPIQYIIKAGNHINLATQYEIEQNYEKAFEEYKSGIDILLKNVKDDPNYDRKEMVRFKTEKYLLRAEKLYNLYLSTEIKEIQQYVAQTEEDRNLNYKPLSDLYKYKVIRVINSGMLVLHSEFNKLFYVKVIQKTARFSNDNLILPDHVPYMVKLHHFYNCENALFLVVQFCSGPKLLDYTRQHNSNNSINNEVFFNKSGCYDYSSQKTADSDSESSYTNLINDYTYERAQVDVTESKKSEQKSIATAEHNKYEPEHSDSIAEEVEESEINNELPVYDLMQKSQQLLSSVDDTLHQNSFNTIPKPLETCNAQSKIDSYSSSQRKLSDMSNCDEIYDEVEGCPLAGIDSIKKWAAQIVLALHKLHSLDVICCNLNINDILIDEEGDVVLTYICNTFEKSNVYNLKEQVLMAPEMYTYSHVSKAVDWWSLGTILYELLVGVPLKYIYPNGISDGVPIKIPKYVSAEGRSLLRQLLAFAPSDRFINGKTNSQDLKTHPFFNGVSWEKLLEKYLL